MKFTLKIDLGNAAMLTGEDIAGALREVARKIEREATCSVNDDGEEQIDETGGGIIDDNGNRVGSWAVIE